MRVAFRSSISVLLLGTGLATAAHAQQAAAPAAEDGLEDIVVTAEKRSLNLQDVPSAITAIGADTLKLRDVTDVRDLSALAPNLAVLPGTGNPAATIVAIRGIPTPGDEALTLDTPIGIYVDGVYLARSAASAVFMSDIERVEVLRGPQGTLFGRNTTGGGVSFTMRRPGQDFGGVVEAGYGNFDARRLMARVDSGTIADIARFSLTYVHRENEGYVDNRLQPDDDRDPGAGNIDAIRAALEIDLGDTGSLYYSFDYSDMRNNAPAFQTTVATAAVRGFLAASTTSPGCDLTVVPTRRDSLCLDDDARTRNKLYGHVVRAENDFGDFTIRSTTGYRSWRGRQSSSDVDGFGTITGPLFSQATLFNGLPAGLIAPIVGAGAAPVVAGLPVPTGPVSLFEFSNRRSQNQFSQEFEIVSKSGGSFDWVLGAFYFHEKAKEDNPQTAGFVLDVANLFRNNPAFGPLGPILAGAVPAATRYRVVLSPSELVYSTQGESMALYGQASYHSDGGDGPFGATLGLRYTWDEKSIRQTAPFANSARVKFSEPTGHFTLDYRFGEGVNGYAKVARGYRSGGFNVRTSQTPFEPETLWSYETGLKTEFWNRRARINLAAFYAKYSDQQISQPITNATGGFGVLTVNAGKTDYKGLEIEASVTPVDGLLLNGAFGFVDRKIKRYPLTLGDGTVIDVADQVVNPGNGPRYTASGGIQYKHGFASGITALARIGASYESSKTYFVLPQVAPFVEQLRARPRMLVDAQLRVDKIRIGNGPEMFVQLWGKNILDKVYETRAIDFGALGFGGFYYGQPASYGIDVGFRF